MEFDRSKITFIFLGILVMVAVGAVLKTAQSVILPLIIAWLLSFLIGPAINFMTARKIPTTLAVLIIIIVLLGIFYLSGTFLYARFAAFVEAYPRYHARFTDLIAMVTSKWNLAFDPLAGINWGQNIGRFLASFSRSIFAFVSQLVLVVIFLFFILLGKPFFRYKILKSFSSEDADQIARITFSITGQIRRYLSLQFLISFTTGVLVWLALEFIGVDFAGFACAGSILSLFLACCDHPFIGDHHPDGHGKRPGAQDPGGSVELKPGSGFAISSILGLVVGYCRGAAFNTDRSGN
jgi:predicted PurR-regulated permease PerM